MKNILKRKTVWVGLAILSLAIFGGEMPQIIKDNMDEIVKGLVGAGFIALRLAIEKLGK